MWLQFSNPVHCAGQMGDYRQVSQESPSTTQIRHHRRWALIWLVTQLDDLFPLYWDLCIFNIQRTQKYSTELWSGILKKIKLLWTWPSSLKPNQQTKIVSFYYFFVIEKESYFLKLRMGWEWPALLSPYLYCRWFSSVWQTESFDMIHKSILKLRRRRGGAMKMREPKKSNNSALKDLKPRINPSNFQARALITGELLALCDSFSSTTREFYFDRSPRIFENILGLYRCLLVTVF